jgi:hypothetical protein
LPRAVDIEGQAAGMSDSKPDKRQSVSTDPGLGEAKATTDPGLAPQFEPFPSIDRSAPTPPESSAPISHRHAQAPPLPLSASPSPRPVVVRFGGEPTPLPPEVTEGLLSGLIASENEAYFQKTKAAAESAGEANASFHGAAHSISPGIPTPLPEPPVMLRTSVELDIANAAALRTKGDGAGRELEKTQRIVRPKSASPDPTFTMPPPRSAWGDKWIAFAGVAVTLGAVGILAVRWLDEGGTAASQEATSATPTATPTPTPTPTPTESATPTAEVDAGAAVRPGSKVDVPPRATVPSARRVGGSSNPPPKDDVKRTM